MNNKYHLGPQAQVEEVKEPKFKKFIFPISFGIALFIITLFVKDIFAAKNAKEVFKFLCDAATMPTVLLFCLWGLTFSANKGTFDGLAFSMRSLFGALIPGYALKKGTNFGDYKIEKEKNRKPVANTFLITSSVFFVLMILFLVIYSFL